MERLPFGVSERRACTSDVMEGGQLTSMFDGINALDGFIKTALVLEILYDNIVKV